MMRTGATRALLRPFTCTKAAPAPSLRFTHAAAFKQAKRTESLALSAYRPVTTSLVRNYASSSGYLSRNPEFENKLKEGILKATPEAVSGSSSATPMLETKGEQEEEVDMMAGIRHDMKVIKDTFALDDVPKEAYRIGLAGVIPYLATSTATVVAAFELSTAHASGTGYFMNAHTAELCLHVLEPLQVGYGAAILSFLGAIHWGLEWAGYGGTQGYRRYAIGVAAPAVGWATVMLPVEYALISQFLAFNLLYTVDSQATIRGWTPPWYSSYRFMLTFVVGASIVISLIGRGQIMDRINRLPTATDRFRELQAEAKAHGEEVN